jgi:quercetin dioxygenase-like cupin family protein
MKIGRVLIAVISVATVSWAVGANPPAHDEKPHAAKDQGFILPDKTEWKNGPPSLPAGAKFAILEGDPAKEGYFAMRLKLPNGYEVPAHWHPNVERVTVISGTFHLAMGDKRGPGAKALPAGSYAFMPPGMRHFAWVEGETVIQIATEGPWAINYMNPSDDPRRKQ